MPTIVRLRYCTIHIYPHDHNPPHFHIRDHGGRKATVAIESLEVLSGAADRRAMREAVEWAAKNRDNLRVNWIYQQGGDA